MLSVIGLSGLGFTAQTVSVYAQKKDGRKEPVPPPVVKDKDKRGPDKPKDPPPKKEKH